MAGDKASGGGGALVGGLVALIGAPILILVLLVSLLGGGSSQSGSDCGEDANVSVSADAPAMVKKYAKDLAAAGKEAGMAASWLAAQIEAESGWNAKAQSPAGAKGLTQFMPGTWASVGQGDPFDPRAAIKAQGKYLGQLRSQLGPKGSGKPDLVFAAYNAGPGAVQSYGGVPPFGETQGYVQKINGLHGKYDKLLKDAGSGSSAMPAKNSTDGCGGGTGAITAGDDYPFKTMPHCDADYISCPAASPLGGWPSECVDWVLWKLNQAMGGTRTRLKVTGATFRPDGVSLGNANTYADGWKAKGWPIDHKPDVGDVVWYDAGRGGRSAMGHVATVKAVNSDGTFMEEGYNGLAKPNDHKHYVTKVKDSEPSAFLTVPRSAKAGK